MGYGYRAINFNPGCDLVPRFIEGNHLAVGNRVRFMCILRWALLVLVVGSLSGAEYTPCGCDCNTPTIETLEIEDLIERIYIQHLIYYPEEITTVIIYKI